MIQMQTRLAVADNTGRQGVGVFQGAWADRGSGSPASATSSSAASRA